MKKIILIAIAFLFAFFTNAQVNNPKKFTQLSLRGGIDNATKHHFTQFVKMPLKGFNAGASFDKYWDWYGVGIDVDYMGNEKPVYNDAFVIAKYGIWYHPFWLTVNTSSTKLTRTFAGIGPSFKHQSLNNKFIAELNLRGGLTETDGSSVKYGTKSVHTSSSGLFDRDGDASGAAPTWGIFYHDGYKKEWLATAKAQVRLNYYVSQHVGINLGGYYMHYFGSKAKYNYLDVASTDPLTPNVWNLPALNGLSALSSIGFTAGVSFRFGKFNNAAKSSKNNLTVTVKDELTGQPLSNAEITVVSAAGKVYTATTNATGAADFTKLEDGNYTINGSLHDIATNQQNVILGNTNRNGAATLLHNDPRFTVTGKAINLKNNRPEAGVAVSLKNQDKGSIKMATSQTGNGGFSFQIDANTDYELVGKKASYISNIEKITTKGLTRSQTLYVELEIGVEEVEIGKSLMLQKIYYDLDKADIREDASSDLEKLTVFLQDNPSYKIEIASHTDSRGTSEHNLKLSQDRAQSVVNFLTQKGIAADRLTAVGYGETRLINKCADGINCTEEEHQMNRRTEFTLTGN
jgi:outer membrane protein OmpA-like peptidoglycan-associated protein